jgi:hypothetical protein
VVLEPPITVVIPHGGALLDNLRRMADRGADHLTDGSHCGYLGVYIEEIDVGGLRWRLRKK